MYVLLKLHRIVQVSAVATRLTARILGARTRHSHGIRNTCARQIRGVVAAAVVDDMRRALWIRSARSDAGRTCACLRVQEPTRTVRHVRLQAGGGRSGRALPGMRRGRIAVDAISFPLCLRSRGGV